MIDLKIAPYAANKVKKTAIFFVASGSKLTPEAKDFDEKNGKCLTQAMKFSRFVGEHNQHLRIAGVDGCDAILLIGLGKTAELKEDDWRHLGIKIGRTLHEMGVAEGVIVLGENSGKLKATAGKALLEGTALAAYRFNHFKTQKKPHQQLKIKGVTLLAEDKLASELKTMLPQIEGLIAGSTLARELVNMPPNIANPGYMAENAAELKKLGIKIEILKKKDLEKLGMNLMLAVGRGAAKPEQEPHLIIMKYEGAGKKAPWRSIVGKGVMFDTGGYQVKPARPSSAMGGMKGDMAGAGAVMGAMKALALRKSKVNVVGVVGCVMNLIDGNSFLPSEILTSYKGLTVEIGHTDAEGRLVLADAMSYIIDKEKPAEVIDLATLTGACMVALGGVYAGLFSANDKIVKALKSSSEDTGEKVWHMPVDDVYAAKSKYADASNDGAAWGGASAAAAFLKKFTDDTPWAHIDIAGVAMDEKIPGVLPVDGASGFGVRLLVDYLEKTA